MYTSMVPTISLPRRLQPPGKMLARLMRRVEGTYGAVPRQFAGGPITCQQGRFAIIGDLQLRSRMEFWRKSNAQQRVRLIQQIVTEAPDFLAIVGDLVFQGSSAADWAAFDTLASPLDEARMPVLPLLGNHDYGLVRRTALPHFFRRFPHLDGRHWFATTYGPLGLIFLDSNVRRLPAARWHAQVAWYRHTLQRFELDPEVQGVLVLLHHPPYTNSPLVADAQAVQRAFVPPFVRARKTLVMIAGHVHTYERFARAGKTFLVTGGGGPRVKVATGRRRRHSDECFGGPAVRNFHFLMLTPSPTGLEIAMRGLHAHCGEFATLDHIALPWRTSTV
jgi:3',5'-cyclic AMP phosphodiesterase CpdA